MKGLPFSTIIAWFVIWGAIYACKVVTAGAQAVTLSEDNDVNPTIAAPECTSRDNRAPLQVKEALRLGCLRSYATRNNELRRKLEES